MKKLYLLFVLFVGLSFTNCSNGNDFTSKDLEANQLKGNVKSLKVSTYEAVENFGKVVKGKLKLGRYETIDITEFDKLGNISIVNRYNRNGDLEGKTVYTYNNNKTDYFTSYNSEGNISSKTVYEWDGDLLMSMTIYDNKGREGAKTVNEYDGEKLKSTSVYVLDQLRYKNVVTEFDDDLPIESVSYDRNGKESNRTTLEYKNGKLALHSTYNGSYAVNEEGLTTKSVDCYKVGNDYTEDVKGIFIYEYEFDKKGNWVRCIVYKEEIKIPYQIVEREILYR